MTAAGASHAAARPARLPPDGGAAETISKNFPALSGLRAIAALTVVCFHYWPAPRLGWAYALIETGPAAVGFFFLLSGFVLAISHPELSSVRSFWKARLIRIYPMYLFAFVLFLPMAVVKYHGHPHTFALSFALNMTMLQAWTNLSESWNGPSWSLSVEAFLYFAFPFVLRAIAGQKNPLWWALPLVIPTGVAFAFCSGHIPRLLWRGWIAHDPVLWLPIFVFGMALGLWRTRHPAVNIPVGGLLAGAAAAVAAAVILLPPAYREVFAYGAGTLGLAAIVVLSTYPSRLGEALLGNPLIVRLGSASYITYIVQGPLWHYYKAITHDVRHLRWFSGPHAPLIFFFIFVVALSAASLLLEAYVDEPLRAWLKKPRPTRRRDLALSLSD